MAVLDKYLESVKGEPDLNKTALRIRLRPAAAVMCEREVPNHLMALAADVLGRIGHILMVLNLADHESVPQYLERAVQLDPFNLFARTALLRWRLRDVLGDETSAARVDRVCPEDLPDAVSCWPSGASDADQAIRVGIHLVLRRLLDDARSADPDRADGETEDLDMRIARALVTRFIDHTDSIYLRLEVINHYLMRPRLEAQRPELAEQPPVDPYLEFVSLRRFGGSTPFLPRPGAASAVGGGYLVRICSPSTDSHGRPEIFNVLVDPGDGLVDNLYREGFGIADIDLVIATNDHPDHLAALDAIISLRNGRRPLGNTPRHSGVAGVRLPVLGNASVIERYRPHPHVTARELGNPYMHKDLGLSDGVSIDALPVIGKGSVPFKLTFKRTGVNRSITFMSDTAIVAPDREIDGASTTIDLDDSEWRAALESDIVVANVGEVSVGELRSLALPDRANAAGEHAADKFYASIAGLADHGRADEAARIKRALSLPPRPDSDAGRAGLPQAGWPEEDEGLAHLNLRGLIAVAKQMSEGPPDVSEQRSRVLVVGELREHLGALRRTIADEINIHILGIQTRTIALTADVGLCIRIDDKERSRVLCSVCSLNNDRLDAERFHAPRDMREVCVKGDDEATYWMCGNHESESSFFIEHCGSYRPLAAGSHWQA